MCTSCDVPIAIALWNVALPCTTCGFETRLILTLRPRTGSREMFTQGCPNTESSAIMGIQRADLNEGLNGPSPMTQSLASTTQGHPPLMHGVFETRSSRNISSSPRNSSTTTPCLQLRQIQGYDCLLVHVRSPVGIVPRTRHICLATNQSQVRERLPWFRGSRKQRMASCASARDLTPAICSSPGVRSTSLDTVKRMSSLCSYCCR